MVKVTEFKYVSKLITYSVETEPRGDTGSNS